MAVRIIVDSGSDITKEQSEALDIKVIPLKVSFGDEEYLDGGNLDHMTFYEKLIESDSLPKTSQIAPAEYEDIFDEALEAGDEVVCFTLSSELSGCFQSANIAASDKEGVYIIDTGNVAIAERIMVEYAVSLRDKGWKASDIASELNEKQKKLKILALLDTLEYLKKGGRISSATAIAGEILQVKPVVTVVDGKVVMVGKARGSKNGNNLLINLAKDTGGIDFNMPVAVAYSGLSDKLINKYLNDSISLYEGNEDKIRKFTIGAAIGTHVGPGAIAVAFFAKGDN